MHGIRKPEDSWLEIAIWGSFSSLTVFFKEIFFELGVGIVQVAELRSLSY
jgi:hypothetical protein